jgi:hypothetical protein
MLMDHITRYLCSHYVIRLDGRLAHVVKELVAEVGDVKGRDLRLEARRIRPWASRDRHRDDVGLEFAAPHNKQLVVDVTVTSVRMNSNVPIMGVPLSFHGSLALGAQQAKHDADIRTSSCLGTFAVHS